MRGAVLAIALMAAGPGFADPAPAADAADAGAAAVGPICADRPTKSNGPCTVEPGHFQYELDVVDLTHQRFDGVTTDTWFIADPMFKVGVAKNLDLEATISPVEIVRTRIDGGPSQTVAGISDLYLRVKWGVYQPDNGPVQIALLPFLKLPTARATLGNGAVEGGLIAPLSVKLSPIVTVTVDPELDVLENARGDGRHAATAQVVDVGFSLPKNVTLSAELWGGWNFDPAGVVRQTSADAAVAWLVTPRIQLDLGANFGLERSTPGVQVYLGVSQKF
jgi:hypothetical protein